MKKIIVSLLLLTVFTVFSQVPNTISYQGQLLDNIGNPVIDGNTTATFSFYDASSGGSQVWWEEQIFPTTNGVFNIELGSSRSFSEGTVDFANPIWLEIELSGQPAMTPRVEILSSPFSQNSANIIGGIIENSTIGNSTPAAATFTSTESESLNVTGNSITANSATLSISSIDFASSTMYIPNSVSNGAVLTSDGNGNATWETINLGTIATQNSNNVSITGGSIDNTEIGNTTATSATFTGIESSSFTLTEGAQANYVLTSDEYGQGTWQTASGGGGSLTNVDDILIIYKKSNQDITTTTLTDALDLSIDLEASSTYLVRAHLFWNSTSGVEGGATYKYRIDYSGTVDYAEYDGNSGDLDWINTTFTNGSVTTNTSVATLIRNANIVTNNAGTLKVQFANHLAPTDEIIMMRGSYLKLIKLK